MSLEIRLQLRRKRFLLAVDLVLPERGVTAFFGPSGCGKTTLLRAVAGLEPGCRGRLCIAGQCWQDAGHFLPPHRRPLGYLFQEPSLFAHLNVRRNLEYGFRRRHRADRHLLDQAVELLGIGSLLERHPHQLSGGEQQRVALARALASGPELLLLDEPLAALDQPRREEILPYLESLQHELALPILYVSHSRSEVARLAKRLVLMKKGRATAVGTVAALFSRLDLELAHAPDAAALIEARVLEPDARYQLGRLAFPGGQLLVAGQLPPPGQTMQLRILARDVSITLERQRQTSILNIFPARIRAIAETGPAQVTVQLAIGPTLLLSRITRKSAEELKLAPGMPVHAQVKSVALLG